MGKRGVCVSYHSVTTKKLQATMETEPPISCLLALGRGEEVFNNVISFYFPAEEMGTRYVAECVKSTV